MGLFQWIWDTVTEFSNNSRSTYEWIQGASWDCIYNMLKKESAFSAKGQGMMKALAEKIQYVDSEKLQQLYEYEVRHSADKTNQGGFMILKREIEQRGLD